MRAFLLNSAVVATVLTGSLVVPASWAQVYKCGKAYQDRPCEGAQAAKPITGISPGPKPADSAGTSASARMNPVCAQRGVESQKIVWTRESGATEEKLLSEETNPARKQLITDVYRVRGSAPQVRARIEAECEAEMAEKARAAAAYEAMVRSGAAPAKEVAPAGPTPEERAAEAKRRAQESEQRIAVAKKERCNSLNAQLDSIRERQRSGGSAAYMDSLNRQRYDVDRSMREVGCL